MILLYDTKLLNKSVSNRNQKFFKWIFVLIFRVFFSRKCFPYPDCCITYMYICAYVCVCTCICICLCSGKSGTRNDIFLLYYFTFYNVVKFKLCWWIVVGKRIYMNNSTITTNNDDDDVVDDIENCTNNTTTVPPTENLSLNLYEWALPAPLLLYGMQFTTWNSYNALDVLHMCIHVWVCVCAWTWVCV